PPVAPAIEAMPALVKPGIQARFAQKANKAKAAAGATDTILKALGIFSQSSSTTNPADSPDLKVSIHAGYPELSFHLYGYQAVNIYKDGKLCKTAHSSPYKDKDLPAAGTTALVKYKAIYLDHDEETGTMSPEVSIAVEGK
ncbi:MAG: hypothetical protein NTU43_12855, partial [Bacteroidetes bacterium]|nr:hypothetical protein [Bacteroidota bacterium]